MKEGIKEGYYIKARCIQDSEISIMPPYVREIWDWLLKEANHKDNKIKGTMIKRGQLIRTYKDIQEGLHWKKGYCKLTYKKWQCENSMKLLTKLQMITTTKTTRGLFITICNYCTYQNPKNYESHNDSHKRATREPQTTDTINKKGNKDKKDKKKEEQNKEAPFSFNFTIDKWNEKLEPKIRQLSESRKDKLRVRLKERMFTDNYEKILEIIKTTPFLQGSNDRGWTADFDWLIANDTNYLKVLEGKYKNKSKGGLL